MDHYESRTRVIDVQLCTSFWAERIQEIDRRFYVYKKLTGKWEVSVTFGVGCTSKIERHEIEDFTFRELIRSIITLAELCGLTIGSQ